MNDEKEKEGGSSVECKFWADEPAQPSPDCEGIARSGDVSVWQGQGILALRVVVCHVPEHQQCPQERDPQE